MRHRPLPTKQDFGPYLRGAAQLFEPLIPEWSENSSGSLDAVLRLSWQGKRFEFGVEFQPRGNPRMIEAAADNAVRSARGRKLLPLVVVPFLTEEAMETLERRSVSGMDLCGNRLIVVPGELYIHRIGKPNLFRAEGVIKNVYRGSSSVVARLFLIRPEFGSVQEALQEIRERGGRVTLSTVSKVCKQLENDLIIDRKREGATQLRLIQPEKLLDRLVVNHVAPRVRRRLSGKLLGLNATRFRVALREWSEKTGNLASATGLGSVGAYAVMAREGLEQFYCTDLDGAVKWLGDQFLPTDRFATVSLEETRDDEAYFDRRKDLTASPVQTFLELSTGDKRDRETADQVRRVLLDLLKAK